MADRIDKALVDRGILKTRSQAKMLIEQGCIFCNEKKVVKSSMKVEESDKLEVKEMNLYVSRGAYKMEKALVDFDIDPRGLIVADVGASTGGFTQVCLEAGASKVYAIDVGHDQLSDLVKNDARVVNLEGTNIKYPLELDEKVDLCVVDLSFISIRLVFKNIYNLLKSGGKAMVLIKPQFEAGKERMGKQGLIADDVRVVVLEEVKQWFSDNDYHIEKITESPIKGNKSGNIEYLSLVTKP